MTTEEHKQKHIELHQAIDELFADYIQHNEPPYAEMLVIDLLKWSYQQTQNPTENEH